MAIEDNVLYTAQRYVSSIKDERQQAAAKQLIAPLMRPQHLSQVWLTAAALSSEADKLLLGAYQAQLRELLMLKAANIVGSNLHESEL